MTIKHSKYKNTGVLFELLIRQITSDTLDGKDSPVKTLLKKYFVKTELGKEYKLYETLLKKTSLTESKANIIIDTLVNSSKTLNRRLIKKQKYNLISEIKEHYNLNKFFNHKLPNYKIHAAFYTLLEIINSKKSLNPEQIISNKVTILEHLTVASIKKDQIKDDVMKEIDNSDNDVRFLTYKILMERFNSKYDNLNDSQKLILKEYINSVDNTTKLKELYESKVKEIKENLTILNKKTKNKVTKIKINEVISLIKSIPNQKKIKDNNLIDLMQYYDLIEELEKTNG
jgi:hypothetical protein